MARGGGDCLSEAYDRPASPGGLDRQSSIVTRLKPPHPVPAPAIRLRPASLRFVHFRTEIEWAKAGLFTLQVVRIEGLVPFRSVGVIRCVVIH